MPLYANSELILVILHGAQGSSDMLFLMTFHEDLLVGHSIFFITQGKYNMLKVIDLK